MSARRRPTAAEPAVVGVDLVDLRATSCRWPCGEDPVRYCGEATGGVLASYCPAHRQLAYSKRAPREERPAAAPPPPSAGRARA